MDNPSSYVFLHNQVQQTSYIAKPHNDAVLRMAVSV